MNWVDIVIILVLLIGAGLGVVSGFIWQLARIGLLIAATYLTFILQTPLSGWLVIRMSNPWLARLIVYIFLFAVIYLVLFFITWIIEKSIVKVELKSLDRVLGGVLGLLKTALICGAILLGFITYPGVGFQSSFKGSFFTPLLLQYTRKVVFLMPKEYRDKIRVFVRQINTESPSKDGQQE